MVSLQQLPVHASPLFPCGREYPRPSARNWVSRIASQYSLRRPANDSPWLPLTTSEGLLVVGHKDPSCDCPYPGALAIRVCLRAQDYDQIHERATILIATLSNAFPDLEDAYGLFEQENHEVDRRFRPAQFLLNIGLLPRSPATERISEYLESHRGARWIYEANARRQPILPVEELPLGRLPAGVLPDELVSRFKCVCYERDGNTLHLVVPAGTTSTQLRTQINGRVSKDLSLSIAFGDPDALAHIVDTAAASSPIVAFADSDSDDATDDDGTLDCGADNELLSANPAMFTSARDVVRWSVLQAFARGASDIHYEMIEQGMATIRLRVLGKLRNIGYIKPDLYDKVISFIKIRCNLNHSEKRLPLDGKFRAKAGNREADIRVSTCPVVVNGNPQEAASLRVLGRIEVPNIEALGVSPYQLRQIRWIVRRSHGLFLLTGPTGSGKTTTLNAILREVASEEVNTISIEDPVELPLKWVRQSQVNKEVDFTFATGLRAFLRQDPDVLAVGEIRDQETAGISIESSNTGHLVFATMHTNTALMSFDRLRRLGFDSGVVASTLLGSLSQRLIRILCQNCREHAPASDEHVGYVKRFCKRVEKSISPHADCPEAAELLEVGAAWLKDPVVYRPVGCPSCQDGYARRRPVMEVYLLANDPEAVDIVLAGEPSSKLQAHFAAKGNLDLAGRALLAFLRKETTYAEIEEHLPLL